MEVATGLGLMIDPRLVVALLVGANTPVEEIPMGRLPGIAILALGLACWPSRQHTENDSSAAFRAMLVYNTLIALFLVYLFKVGISVGAAVAGRCAVRGRGAAAGLGMA